MKRLFNISLSILLSLFLVSCNLNEPDTPQDVIKKNNEQKERPDKGLLFSLDKGETFQIIKNIFKESIINTTNFITERFIAYTVLYLEKYGTVYVNQMINALNER